MKHIKSLMLATAFATAALTIAGTAQAQVQEQYIALPSYRVGPYAAGGSGFYGASSITSTWSTRPAASTASRSAGKNAKPNTTPRAAWNAMSA